MDVKLPIAMPIKLRFHYLMCAWCQRYEKQLLALQKISSALPEHPDDCCSEILPDSSKERLKQALRERKPELWRKGEPSAKRQGILIRDQNVTSIVACINSSFDGFAVSFASNDTDRAVQNYSKFSPSSRY